MGLEKPNLGLDPSETFFPNSVSVLDSDETFQISRNPGLDVDENVCLLDSQLCIDTLLMQYASTIKYGADRPYVQYIIIRYRFLFIKKYLTRRS